MKIKGIEGLGLRQKIMLKELWEEIRARLKK